MAMTSLLQLLSAVITCAATVPTDVVQPISNTSSSIGKLGLLDGFSFPTLGQLGDEVLFQGSFPNTSALLVFGAHGGGLVDSVYGKSLDTAIGTYTAIGESSLATSKGKSRLLAFVATVQKAGKTVDSLILQIGAGNGQTGPVGSILPIASTGQALSKGGPVLTSLSAPMVTYGADGELAYVAFQASATGWQGIVLAKYRLTNPNLPVEFTVVADSKTLIPKTKLPMLCLGSQAVSETGDVVFFASHCSDSATGSPAVAAQRAAQMMFRTQRKRFHSLASAGDVNPGIFHWSATEGLTVVADPQTAVPAGAFTTAAQFVAFSNPAISRDGTCAFVGETSVGLGIFTANPMGQGLSAVATTATLVPGSSSALFSDFPYVPSVGVDNVVVFYASAPGVSSGIYSGKAASSGTNTGNIQAELTMGDTVAGQSLVFIGFGTNAYSDVSNVYASYLVLNNGMDGVWTFTRKGANNTVVV